MVKSPYCKCFKCFATPFNALVTPFNVQIKLYVMCDVGMDVSRDKSEWFLAQGTCHGTSTGERDRSHTHSL